MSWPGLLSIILIASAALDISPALAAVPPEPAEWPASMQAAVPDELSAARAAFERRDYATAYRMLQPLAQAGMAPAQVGLGRLYALGLGISRNDAEAIKWYRLAAEQGDPDGMSSLAHKYRFSSPPLQNNEQALAWYRRAAELDHPDALNASAASTWKASSYRETPPRRWRCLNARSRKSMHPRCKTWPKSSSGGRRLSAISYAQESFFAWPRRRASRPHTTATQLRADAVRGSGRADRQ